MHIHINTHTLGGSEYLQRFLDAGYDLPFIHTHGLSDVDLDCIGVPVNKMGLRRKMSKLHGLDRFYVPEEEGEGGEEDEEGERSEEEEEAESDEG
ncbi:hypothetical protein EON63_21385 [archaeon]|nr:MAG: hypothetical protein EON63_21385 [archaeon]